MDKNIIELLAPAGDMEKLKTALHFGADAVYFAGKNYGLRAFSGNFDDEEIIDAVNFVHAKNKKAYVTINIVAKNSDFVALKDYLFLLQKANVDAVIVSDFGIMQFIKKYAPSLKIHISTQANITNKYSAAFMADFAERLILARELSIDEISEIKQFVPNITLEAFVHGAMCISYSGRCLISNYLANRDSNHGECAQSCRWKYSLYEESRNQPLTIEQDEKGTYILNSKDLNMIQHLDKLFYAGITSFKIEGRAKSAYYVGATVNAYKKAVDILKNCVDNKLDNNCDNNVKQVAENNCTNTAKSSSGYNCPNSLTFDLLKVSHRAYCTGFYLGNPEQYYESSKPMQDYQFCAVVTKKVENGVIIEQRNRFKQGDVLEVVSGSVAHGQHIWVSNMLDFNERAVTDALLVQQQLFLPTNLNLKQGDMLIKKLDTK